jgi:heme-degrading monooxygenase HmoA
MYARVLTFDGAKEAQREEAKQRIRDEVIPRLEGFDGFVGFVGLFDAENSKAKSIVLWESREAAEAAESQLAERRKEMVEGMGMTIAANRLLEAPIVEVHAGVRA